MTKISARKQMLSLQKAEGRKEWDTSRGRGSKSLPKIKPARKETEFAISARRIVQNAKSRIVVDAPMNKNKSLPAIEINESKSTDDGKAYQ